MIGIIGVEGGEMRRVPDFLTASRAMIAVGIVLLGIKGSDALELVILLTIIGWTTDILDGRIARRYYKETSWVGEREFVFDVILIFSGLCYLVMAGFVPLLPAIIFLASAAIFIIYFRSKSVTMSFAFPLVLLPFFVAYFNAPRAALLYAIWTVTVLLIDWQRFKGVVLEFIENARAIQKH